MITLEAIIWKCPDANVELSGGGVVWLDGTELIPESEYEQVQKDWEAHEKTLPRYKRNEMPEWKLKRMGEYPDLGWCIHALLDGGAELEELQEDRRIVKEKYPKPKE